MKIVYIAGDEPYLVDKAVKEAIGELDFPDMNLLRCESFSKEVYDFLQSFPFCENRRVVYVTVDDLSDADIPKFKEETNFPDSSTLVIRARNYDARKAFTKALQKENKLNIFSKENVSDKLFEIVSKIASDIGLTLKREVMDEFLNREGYGVCEETTLYTIQSDLINIFEAFGGNPTKKDIASLVEVHDVGNSFLVADMIRRCDICGLKRQAESLKGQEIPALLALLREYRLSYKCLKGYSNKELGIYRSPGTLTMPQALSGIQIITNAILQFKAGAIPKSNVLQNTYLRLAYEAN